MNQRIKQLRKALGMTLDRFGKSLGVGRSAISKLENEERSVTDQMVKAICSVYRVNETWLRTGEGNMFDGDDTEKSIAALVEKYGLSSEATVFIQQYIMLSEEMQEVILEFARRVGAALDKRENEPDIAAAEAAYEKVFGIQSPRAAPASNTTDGTQAM